MPGWAPDILPASVTTEKDLSDLVEAGYFRKGLASLLDEGLQLEPQRRRGHIVVFTGWFHAGLCLPVHPFLLEFLDTYGIELAQLLPLAILHLNVFRWLRETALWEPPTMRLFLLLFTVHVEERRTLDESTWSAFGSVAVRLRPGFHDEFP